MISQIATPTAARNTSKNSAHSHRLHVRHPDVARVAELVLDEDDRSAGGTGEEISEYGAIGADDDIMTTVV